MIKIDRGLIADIVGGERDRIVVKAMIRLARELDLKVVVEGVESTGQLALLADWGCDLYQGFLGAGALTQEEIDPLRRDRGDRSRLDAPRRRRTAKPAYQQQSVRHLGQLRIIDTAC